MIPETNPVSTNGYKVIINAIHGNLAVVFGCPRIRFEENDNIDRHFHILHYKQRALGFAPKTDHWYGLLS